MRKEFSRHGPKLEKKKNALKVAEEILF